MSSNAIHVIHPYWDSGSLVFDDPRVGLAGEPFVAGADEVLGILSGGLERFTIVFSGSAFPGAQAVMERLRPEGGGWWYRCESVGRDGWLCPALFKYFTEAPEEIHIQIKERK
jgi:hypothetical protein